MSKKSRRRRQRTRKRSARARFATGIQVRVKAGTTDPDFPDIPLGGWSGTVIELDDRSNPPSYLIEWDRCTLDQMHPVYRKRCERDGIRLESRWLGEDDVEPDTGEPAPIEQPTRIISRPLKMSDQDDRIRAICGLTSDDPLPEVHEENLVKYHEYLTRHFTIPFQASYQEAIGRLQYQRSQITVRALLDRFDVEDGLLCEALERGQKIELPLADLERVSVGPNRKLVEDYCYWFWSWQGKTNAHRMIERVINEALLRYGIEEEPDDKPAILRGLALTLAKLGLLGGFYGAILGAALASLDGASVAATIGAGLLAVVAGLLGANYGHLFGAMNRIPYAHWFGGFVGLIIGGLLGALLGLMLVAFVGALAGGILVGILGRYLRSAENRQIRTMLGALAGAMLGVGVQSWMRSAADALWGTWIGGMTGAITGPTLFFAVIVILVILETSRLKLDCLIWRCENSCPPPERP